MIPATETEIKALAGDLDPLTIEQLLELHSTVDEIGQALACIEADREGDSHTPVGTRVAAIYEVLEDAVDGVEEDERDYAAG